MHDCIERVGWETPAAIALLREQEDETSNRMLQQLANVSSELDAEAQRRSGARDPIFDQVKLKDEEEPRWLKDGLLGRQYVCRKELLGGKVDKVRVREGRKTKRYKYCSFSARLLIGLSLRLARR